ncbi:NAD-dependent epimerase/dehydratase family protein [Mucilaginibacter terrenus]|uniref:dTDP-4-dehydrorhamnose reductase n=1 Tax=Mucilaginibacter terrenus TaxID=2482727 RepID=A0A3E2NTS3_9SPHI|nr:family 1 glycosylhydrolase [Mucilaginibacter terrenus]RFZ84408.1 NAD-dependent epimerase/dehydratase family protein [Mucilaginibacter terrenus]
MALENPVDIWGGLECTINRVKDAYHDQFEFGGHYKRENDIDLIGSLGIKMLRYPVLWEKHQPVKSGAIDWGFTDRKLTRLKELNIEPIAGLVHHGSGPLHVNFFDGSFEEGVAKYAKAVAERFPWLEYYTPVNEPLTTARFCGLYGHWYPHMADELSFYKILLSECKATVMAMAAIRKINPDAKLVQTEDLGKTYSTPLLQYQADFENERRWASYELLCGTLTPDKVMYRQMLAVGIPESELQYFLANNCRPHVAGFNYYITSERYLDEKLNTYPNQYHGGNGIHAYADIEIVKAATELEWGPDKLLNEAWGRLGLPMAITECHLHSTREEQMRWFHEMWETVNRLKAEGLDIRAITVWAIFGLHGWNQLVTEPYGDYEPGVFNLSSGYPRPTALARLIRVLTKRKVYYHPVLETEGWWKRGDRLQYSFDNILPLKNIKHIPKCQPVLIIGKSGTLGNAFSIVCDERNIHHFLLSREDVDITDSETVEQIIEDYNPWAIINATGYVDVAAAEDDREACFRSNYEGPGVLAAQCAKHAIKLLTFSSGLVFDGAKQLPYVESDAVSPLNVYGESKARGEEVVLANNPNSLVVRTCNFFGPWDDSSFVAKTITDLKEGRTVVAASDVFVSPTYVPDLIHISLDLMLDNENGVYHVASTGRITWAELAFKIAEMTGLDASLIKPTPLKQMNLKVRMPKSNVLQSEKGVKLPTLESALRHYVDVTGNSYLGNIMAV